MARTHSDTGRLFVAGEVRMSDIVTEAYTRASEHAKMRRALYQLIWEQANQAKPSRDYSDKIIPPRPMPSMTDEQIKDELKAILGISLSGLF